MTSQSFDRNKCWQAISRTRWIPILTTVNFILSLIDFPCLFDYSSSWTYTLYRFCFTYFIKLLHALNFTVFHVLLHVGHTEEHMVWRFSYTTRQDPAESATSTKNKPVKQKPSCACYCYRLKTKINTTARACRGKNQRDLGYKEVTGTGSEWSPERIWNVPQKYTYFSAFGSPEDNSVVS